MEIDITLNGDDVTFEVARSDTLLDVLRDNGYTGAKRGCDTGNCGFCTVIVDGERIEPPERDPFWPAYERAAEAYDTA